jgi:tRNA G18 (ribose-2'-O)-methylase SpoU
MVDVILYGVGRNLNRAYRTCASFGVQRLFLVQCRGEVEGALFSATGKVEVVRDPGLAVADLARMRACALETWGKVLLHDVDWSGIGAIAVGGETCGLSRSLPWACAARIGGTGKPSLTVEAALAVALYSWRLSC